MYCTECGTRLAGGKFCGSCGTAVPSGSGDAQRSSVGLASPGSSAAPQPFGSPPSAGPPAQGVGSPYFIESPYGAGSPSAATGPFGAQPNAFPPLGGPSGTQAVGQPAWPVAASGQRLPKTQYPWDYGRDIGAAVLLIWSLTLPWNYSTKASGVVYVLLTTLVALLSLAVAPLSRILRAPDGSALRWPTLPIRAALCGPYAVVVLIAVIRELTGSASGLGASLQIGVLGIAVAVVPRESELAAMNGPLIAHRFRLVCAVGGGLGIAAVVISTLVAAPPSGWFHTGEFFLLVIAPFLILVGLFVFIFGVTAIRIGMGHSAWQPSLMWIGIAMAVSVIVNENAAAESSRNPFYGLWLFMISAGLAATPLIGGRDGTRSEARFWALVVANAFRLILIAASLLLLVFILVLVQASQYVGVSPRGELIWILISLVGTIAAAAVGSSQLRADPRRGRTVALICVGVMALLRVVDLAVAGWSPADGSGSAGTIALLAGTFGVIVFALLVPAPMRELVGLPPLGSGDAGSTFTSPPSMPADNQSPQAPPVDWNSDLATTVMISNHRAAPPNGPGPSLVKSVGEPTPTADPQAGAAADPATSGQDLMSIAAGRPDLRPVVAANPSTYPALLDWLRGLGDPNVDAALARRRP